jgi:chromosome segregation ATPase
MHSFQKYTELRQNLQGPTSDTSLWPSFTDIMTVILMIFMLTMIAVIIKNSTLREQLSIVVDREREAKLDLQKSEEARAELEVAVTNLDEKLRAKQMEIILLGQEHKILRSTLENKLAIISALEAEKADTKSKIKALNEEMSRKVQVLEEEVRSKEQKVIGMTEEIEKKIDEFNKKYAALIDELNKKKETIVILTQQQDELELALAKQRKEYLSLEDKYNRLVGPARSPLGKKVVTVSYSQRGIYLKGVDADDFEKVSLSELHMKLNSLKAEYKDQLYVKIVIPEKSGLSYNAAWKFTNEILSQYDYYYSNQ